MATIDKELRARRSRMKNLHELNQLVKGIYRNYGITPDGKINGIPVNSTGKVKLPKNKYRQGYFRSTTICDAMPELVWAWLDAKEVFTAFKEDKPEDITVVDRYIYLIGEKDKYKVGFVMNDNQRKQLTDLLEGIDKEVNEAIEHHDAELPFSHELIEDLIDYKIVRPMFQNKRSLMMYLAISELPFIKKFKQCNAVMVNGGRFFDVIFRTYHLPKGATTVEEADMWFFQKVKFIKVYDDDEEE